MNQGFLELYRHPMECIDVNKLRKNSTGADWTDLSIKRHYQEIDFKAKLFEVSQRLIDSDRKNLLIFTRFIEEAEYLKSINPLIEVVTGETKKRERERILDDFKSGKIKAVANVGVLTTGFDFPELETILIARPTMSLALYYQMTGRGIRIHPEKLSTWIIDLGGNYKRFGKVEDLKIAYKNNFLWHIESNGKQLTNVYF